jgi:hypothetical protein
MKIQGVIIFISLLLPLAFADISAYGKSMSRGIQTGKLRIYTEVTQLNAIPSICIGVTWNVTTTTACNTTRLACVSLPTGNTPNQTISSLYDELPNDKIFTEFINWTEISTPSA